MGQQSIALHFSKANAAAKFAALDWLVREGIYRSSRAHLYGMAFAFNHASQLIRKNLWPQCPVCLPSPGIVCFEGGMQTWNLSETMCLRR